MMEKSFEDFDTIEKTVLELIDGGFNSYTEVARLLGVPDSFGEKIFNILYGYGHINSQNQITELGKTSLEEGTKITEYLTKQIISIDALNGCPINIDKSIAKGEMVDTEPDTKNNIVIPNIPEAETVPFLKQLNSDKNIRAICKKRQIININVTEITNSRLIKTEYASAFLVKIKGIKTPLILTKMYDPSKENLAERFTWQPFSVDNTNADLFDHIDSPTVQSKSVSDSIISIYNHVLKESCSDENSKWSKRLLFEDFEKNYKINPDFAIFDNDCSSGSLSFEAFSEINLYSLNMLLSFAKYGAFAYTHHKIHGRVILLRPDNSVPIIALKELQNRAEKIGFNEVLEAFSNNQNQTKSLIDILKEKL